METAATNNLPEEYIFEFIELESGILTGEQAITGSGGPDPFGYTYVDSNEPGGARFEWVDATDGTPLGLADDGEANVTLPFSFNFYGTAATDLRVGNNGGVLFNTTTGDVGVTNGDLGSTTTITFLLLFGMILTPIQVMFIIRPSEQRHIDNSSSNGTTDRTYSNVGNATFELILYETTNNIKYQYLDVVFGNGSYDYGASATAGYSPDRDKLPAIFV